MKTRFFIIIGILISVFLLVAVVYPTINYKTWGNNERYYTPFSVGMTVICDEWFFNDSVKCEKIWEDSSCHQPGSGCIFPEKSVFEQFLEKKATAVFNLKLDDYRIMSQVQDVYPAYTTGNKKAFITQAVAVNGSDVTRYYLTTVFVPDESLDDINVEIYKIISEKCNPSIISRGSECESKYLETMEPPTRSSLDYGWQ